MSSKPDSASHFSPDGLIGAVLDELINRAYTEVAKAPRPTSALLDGGAVERRRRRMERRAVAAVVRALPLHGAVTGPDGQAA